MDAIAEELELARTDGRAWYDRADRPPRDQVLAWRNVDGEVQLAMNCVPAMIGRAPTQWAFLR